MKYAAKKWWNYLLAAAGTGLLIGLGLSFYFMVGEPDWPLKYSFFLMMFGGVTFCLVGFIIQDLYRGWQRKKLNDWKNPLPDEVVNKAWMIYFPLFYSGLASFLVGLIAFLITK